MNICVFGAASSEIDKKYIDKVEELGNALAKQGHNLVFGAGGQGLMGAAARGFHKGGAAVTGVIPHFFKNADIEVIYKKCDELIYTDTMRERKGKMEDLADAFIVVPGGIGTFEEFFEILTLKQLGRHKKPIIIYNIDGYYSSLEALLDNSVEQNFVKANCKHLYNYLSSIDEIIDCLNSDEVLSLSLKDLKDGGQN